MASRSLSIRHILKVFKAQEFPSLRASPYPQPGACKSQTQHEISRNGATGSSKHIKLISHRQIMANPLKQLNLCCFPALFSPTFILSCTPLGQTLHFEGPVKAAVTPCGFIFRRQEYMHSGSQLLNALEYPRRINKKTYIVLYISNLICNYM